jgi:cytochrome P450
VTATAPSATRVPDGPRGHWLWGCWREHRRDPLELLTRAHREFGDIVRYRIGPVPVLQLNHPKYIRYVLAERADNYRKAHIIDRLTPLMGDGLFLSEGRAWREKRRTMQPAFARHGCDAMVAHVVAATAQRLDKWARQPGDEPVELTSELMELSLTCVGRTLFAIDLAAVPDMARLLDTVLSTAAARVQSINPLTAVLPTAGNRRFERALRRLNASIAELIRRRRTQPMNGDLFSLLAAESEGNGGSDRELRDELMTFCLAGRGPTGTALAWMFYLLDRHPDVEERVRDEVATVLESRPPDETTVSSLTYCGMVFKEAMRLYPPIWAITREAVSADRIGGYHVRPGTIVVISPYILHRHPDFWPDPDRFDPERFRPSLTSADGRLAYLPFGAGPRICIGGRFAQLEGQIVLAMAARRFRLRLATQPPVVPEPLITLRPRGGMKMFVRPVTMRSY